MRTTEEIIEAIEFRLKELESSRDYIQAANQAPGTRNYCWYDNRVDELDSLLQYIKEEH